MEGTDGRGLRQAGGASIARIAPAASAKLELETFPCRNREPTIHFC